MAQKSFTRLWMQVLLAPMLVLLSLPALGSTITVSNTGDSGPGSLRKAIEDAASGDTINFSVTGVINLVTPLTIDSNGPKTLTITGPGALVLSISGGDAVPVFIIQPLAGLGGPVTLAISNLTIEHGSSALGGGIYNGGRLTLTACIVTDNTVDNQLGGGIANAGTLSLRNSFVVKNQAGRPGIPGQGGGIYNASSGSLDLVGSIIDDNFADGLGSGGGIFNLGTLTLSNTFVRGNQATLGGGIHSSGSATLDKSKVSENIASGPFPNIGGGGGIYNFFDGTAGGQLSIVNSTVSSNETGQADPGRTIRGVGPGGGILNDEGTLTLTNSTVSFNLGGGNSPDCCAFSGAGIGNIIHHTGGGPGGALVMINSTVTGNRTPDGTVVGGNGAGISGVGAGVHMSNSTVSGNAAFLGPETTGGAFSIDSGNGGGILGNGVHIKNSILENNAGGNCFKRTPGASNRTSGGHNLSDDTTCAEFFTQTGDLNNTPAGLDPAGLKSNGGPTQTIALLADSPAVNAIPVSSCTDLIHNSPIKTDQRGVTRPQGFNCDSGAYEHFQSRFMEIAVETYQIIGAVQTLPVSPGTRDGLVAPLEGAIDSMNRGAVRPAVNQLGAFINQANGLVRGGVLTNQLADPLTSAAQSVIQSLNSAAATP